MPFFVIGLIFVEGHFQTCLGGQLHGCNFLLKRAAFYAGHGTCNVSKVTLCCDFHTSYSTIYKKKHMH